MSERRQTRSASAKNASAQNRLVTKDGNEDGPKASESPLKDADDPYPSLSDPSMRARYLVTTNEKGVLTFEPYKSFLLPYWRFKTPDLARESSANLYEKFLEYEKAGDFIGMDMARKYLQMGMTRAGRYANYSGGRKYEKLKGGETPVTKGHDGNPRGRKKEKSQGHEGKKDKEESRDIFRAIWEEVKERPKYKLAKQQFVEEQKHVKL